MYGRRKLTRVELAVYAVIVAALIVVFASYMLDYMEMAEKAAMESTVNNVTSALNLHYASHVMAGKPLDSRPWMAGNPFELARAFPSGYLGQLGDGRSGDVDRPAWFFDAARGEVLYLPRLRRHLSGASNGEIRFHLQRHASGFGFQLAPTSPYTWGLDTLAQK